MTDGFMIRPDAVQELADQVREQQDVPDEVGQSIVAAGTIDTGDPSLDADTRELAAEIGTVLRNMAKILSGASDGLVQTGQGFVDADTAVASRLDQIRFDNLASGDGAVPAPSPGPTPAPGDDETPVASLPSIAEQLTPTA